MPVEEISPAVARVLEIPSQGKALSQDRLNLLLTPVEVEAVLTWKKVATFSRRNISQIIRARRISSAYNGGGDVYRYRLSQVLAVQVHPRRGRLSKTREL